MILKPRLALALSGACGLVLALLILQRTPPERSRFAPPCVFHRMTGLHCPGCGSTRAVHALLNLRFGEAVKKNVLFLAALPFLGLWAVRGVSRWVRGEPQPQPRVMQRPWVAVVLIAVIVAFGILRNLPWPPFTWLAPH